MVNLVTEAMVEAMVGYEIAEDNGKRPKSSQLAQMIVWADYLIMGELKQATLTDTYGTLSVIALMIILRMIISQRALSNPDEYAIQDFTLTPQEIRLIRIAGGFFEFLSFEVGD